MISSTHGFQETVDLLNQIVSDHPEQISYSYTHAIIDLVSSHGMEISEHLLSIVLSKEDVYVQEMRLAAIYALGFYYKRYDKTDMLGQLIEQQQDLLQKHPLSLEVQSWFYRKSGQYDVAYQLDKELIEKIDITTNPVPYISFSSSVAYLLEQKHDQHKKGLFIWKNETEALSDWENATHYMETAMRQYAIIRKGKKYGKHFSIMGRLYAFYPTIYDISTDKAYEYLEKAIDCFASAIQYESENSEDYFKRYEEYRQYQNRCNLIKLSLKTKKQTQELDNKINELVALQQEIQGIINKQKQQSIDVQEELRDAIKQEAEKTEAIQGEMRSSMDALTAKSIEIIALFTAVIAIMLGGIDIVSNFNIVTGSLFISLFCSLCCLMVCIPALSLKTTSRKWMIALMSVFFIISIILVITCIYLHVKGVI